MITSEVGENSHVKKQAGNAFLVEGVRGDLHDGLGCAAVYAFAKQLQQIARFGSGVRRGKHSACSVILDGAGEDGFAPAVAQHGFEKKCRRCLAVGSGDAAQFELRLRVSEKVLRDGREGAPAMDYCRHSNTRVRCRGSKTGGGIRHDGSSALGDGLRQVAIAIGGAPAKSDKEGAIVHATRIILDARDIRVATGTPNEINTAQKAVKIQGPLTLCCRFCAERSEAR